MPRERLLLIAVIFIVIGGIWAAVQGSWIAVIVLAVAAVWAFALYRLQP